MTDLQFKQIMNQIYHAAMMLAYQCMFIGAFVIGWSKGLFVPILGILSLVLSIVQTNKLVRFKHTTNKGI